MKKVKLFTTIASLCLAVALMAFGVYAALDSSLKVSGSISFTSTTADGYFSKVVITAEDCSVTSGTSSQTGTLEANIADWTGITVAIADGKTSGTLTITATFVNVGSTKNINVAANAGTPAADAKAKVEYGTGTTAVAYGTENTADGASTVDVSITVTFTAIDTAQNSALDWNVEFTAAQA